jgi:lipopolysaccharide biosynthesis protein
MSELAARLIAFYLPQFFPIAENNAFWGPGFTEWTNVASARPLYPGHWQPHIPADLGFYDLRLVETREEQAVLARNAGVEAFCYWHYWLGGGKRILERQFEEVRDTGKPDFPFCLAWANHSWSGVWSGLPNKLLIEQQYLGRDDEEAHFRWASRAFHDPRYTRVNDKPLFVIFQPHGLPSSESFIEHWQRLARRDGLPGIYFIAMSNRYREGVDPYRDPVLAPFDAITLLTPQDYLESHGRRRRRGLRGRIAERAFGQSFEGLTGGRFRRPARFDYNDVVRRAFDGMPHDRRVIPSVLPNWDNTPRSKARGVVYENSTPELFSEYLSKAVAMVSMRAPDERIIFLKAWNEWAEGNYVEPDTRFGHGYLDAIRGVLAQ